MIQKQRFETKTASAHKITFSLTVDFTAKIIGFSAYQPIRFPLCVRNGVERMLLNNKATKAAVEQALMGRPSPRSGRPSVASKAAGEREFTWCRAAGDSGICIIPGPAGLAEEPVAAVDEAGPQLQEARPGRRAPPGRPWVTMSLPQRREMAAASSARQARPRRRCGSPGLTAEPDGCAGRAPGWRGFALAQQVGHLVGAVVGLHGASSQIIAWPRRSWCRTTP